MRQFEICDQIVNENMPELQLTLQQAYERKLRPQCRCREPAVPMYIARLDGQYLIKRMPLSGRKHDSACPSYEPPYELSGLGPLIGKAIQIDEASGSSILKLDFSLSKRGSRTVDAVPSESSATLRNGTGRLSLRALLHYLWDAGELTEWTSLWAGKRGWGRVRSSLMNAARQMTVRSGPLNEILFVPEVFHQEDREQIAARRAAALTRAQASGPGPRKLMMAVAEVKEFAAARDGQKIIVRHLPFPFMVEEGTWKRLSARYETELELWRSSEQLHLILIATFGISSSGVASIEELAIMVVNENWIPFENIHEQRLLERMSGLRRKIVKGLRFNLARERPIVSVTLPGQRPAAVAMFVVPVASDERYEAALAEMIQSRPEMVPWIWRVYEGDMPQLP
jgi:hypothetical protein